MVRSLNVMVCTVVMSALLPAVAVYAGETGSDDILLLTDTGASELSSDVEEENVIDADMLDNGTYEYTVNPDGTLTITGLAGETAETGLDDPVIPGQIAGRKVTAIGKEAFDGGASLRGKLTLSEGIKTVGEHAFSGCNELTELSLPESLVAIKAGGFDNCDLTCKLDLKNVKEIGDEAFANNVFSGALIIPDGVTEVGESAFNTCRGFTSLVIPKSVKSIGYAAFIEFESIETVTNNSKCVIPAGELIAESLATKYVFVSQSGHEAAYGGEFKTGKYTRKELPTNVSLNKKSVTVKTGKSKTLKASVIPAAGVYDKITWSSSDKKIATVSKDGVVTGVSVGKATIYADVAGVISASCKVTVKKGKTIHVTKVKLNKSKKTLAKGDEFKLSVTISPSNATDKSVKWSSSKKSVASVSQKGVVKAKKKGKATITVTTNDRKKKATCTITVKNPVKVKNVELDRKRATLKVGEKLKLKAKITPKKATNKEVTWRSSKKEVATVTKNGLVRAKMKGRTVITVKTKDGKKKAKCTINVK